LKTNITPEYFKLLANTATDLEMGLSDLHADVHVISFYWAKSLDDGKVSNSDIALLALKITIYCYLLGKGLRLDNLGNSPGSCQSRVIQFELLELIPMFVRLQPAEKYPRIRGMDLESRGPY
jgi:hypothetical protein